MVGVGSFHGFQYDPAGTPWAYAGGAGVAGNGSGFTAGNPDAPEGTQVGFLQGTGSFRQDVPDWAAGTYQISFDAAQRGNYRHRAGLPGPGRWQRRGHLHAPGTSYATYTTVAFTVAAGTHTIGFQGLDTAGGDNTAFLDQIVIGS